MPPKKRLDELLVERGLAPSLARGQSLILAGRILVNGEPFGKAGHRIGLDAEIRVKDDPLSRYVSRGGIKLEGALDQFKIDVSAIVAIDVGASTGGFTDCLLQRGAHLVYAVDVGRNLVHEKLGHDPRVKILDSTNARNLKPKMFDPKPIFAAIDVSFISLKKVLPAVTACLDNPARILALIKPQFEAKRGETKKGVVDKEAIRLRVVNELTRFVRDVLGWQILDVAPSVLTGPKGNIEYFLYASSQTLNKR